jgi:glycosyltransferase involved in cell wall biosynthesis
MDLLVLPSFSEGMPNVILEAMLYGKPVVATRVGGVPEVVVDGKTGRIVESQNSEQLSFAVMKMFQNPDYLRTCGMAGRERVLRYFNPAQRVKRIASLYNEILSRE